MGFLYSRTWETRFTSRSVSRGVERDLQTGVPTEVLTGENQGYAMCHEIEGIDILLTGHQHREISHTMANGVTILQTGCNGHSFGKVKVTFEKTET